MPSLSIDTSAKLPKPSLRPIMLIDALVPDSPVELVATTDRAKGIQILSVVLETPSISTCVQRRYQPDCDYPFLEDALHDGIFTEMQKQIVYMAYDQIVESCDGDTGLAQKLVTQYIKGAQFIPMYVDSPLSLSPVDEEDPEWKNDVDITVERPSCIPSLELRRFPSEPRRIYSVHPPRRSITVKSWL